MEITFIIVNYRQQGLVKQCIKGIEQSAIRLSYEIIVVDNDSQDGTPEMLKKDFPNVRVIQSPKNGGFGYGCNLGFRNARGEYFITINPDVAFVSSAAEKMHDFFVFHTSAGIVGPKLIHPDGSIQYSCRRFPNLLIPLYRRTAIGKIPFAKKALEKYLMADVSHEKTTRVDWIFGAFLMIKRSHLEKVGYFDERFFLYYEDLDLCRRFWEKGFEIWYFPEVEFVHYHQRLSANKSGLLAITNKATRIHIASAIKYFAKYFGVKIPRLS